MTCNPTILLKIKAVSRGLAHAHRCEARDSRPAKPHGNAVHTVGVELAPSCAIAAETRGDGKPSPYKRNGILGCAPVRDLCGRPVRMFPAPGGAEGVADS